MWQTMKIQGYFLSFSTWKIKKVLTIDTCNNVSGPTTPIITNTSRSVWSLIISFILHSFLEDYS